MSSLPQAGHNANAVNETSINVSRDSSRSGNGNAKMGCLGLTGRMQRFRILFVSGIGFLADAYDLFVIDFVKSIIKHTAKVMPSDGEIQLVTSATLAGSVIGQLVFGFLGDFIGRRTMFITTAGLCIFGNVTSALVGFGYRDQVLGLSVLHQLSIVRFLLGVGIGGEYPLSATVTAETHSDDEDKPATGFWYFLEQKPNSTAAVFSMQGLGMIISPIIIMVLIKSNMELEQVWRFCLGIGAVPSAVAFLYRYTSRESKEFEKNKENLKIVAARDDSTSVFDSHDSPAATEASATGKASMKVADTKKHGDPEEPRQKSSKGMKNHLKQSWITLKQFKLAIIGTALTWFLIDVTFYGTASFKSEVVSIIFGLNEPAQSSRRLDPVDDAEPLSLPQLQRNRLRSILASFTSADPNTPSMFGLAVRRLEILADDSIRSRLFKEALMGTAVAGLAVPGYILSTLFIHKTGLRSLTLWGFVGVAVAFLVLGIVQFVGSNIAALDLVLFGLTFLPTNFGPNATTFILPTTVYPSAVRATCHGFSAAMGKVGAVVGVNMFTPVRKALGMGWLQMLCAIVAILGAVATYFFVPHDEDAKQAVKDYDANLAAKATRQQKVNQGKVKVDVVP